MNNSLLTAIENFFEIKISACLPGPRQFVAETYILENSCGNKFFCKIVEKKLFIPEIKASLPIAAAMYETGIERINYPIHGLSGHSFMMDNKLIYLLNYINAPQSYEYSEYAFGKLLAEIHSIKPKINKECPTEQFEFNLLPHFTKYFEQSLLLVSSEEWLEHLKKILQKYEIEIRYYLSEYKRLTNICKTKNHRFVITHGDAPGNVLVKSFEDIYLIDWDAILLAPFERDIWMMDHLPEFLAGYTTIFTDAFIDNEIRSYFIYQYYFQSMVHYLSEIFNNDEIELRKHNIEMLESNLLRGWMMPKLKGISPGVFFD